MKRILTFIFIVALVLSLSIVSMASGADSNEGDNIKAYIEEKIVPVIIGVITSLIALLGALKGVFNALKGLKNAANKFDTRADEIKASKENDIKALKEHYQSIEKSVEDVPKLLERIDAQNKIIDKLEGIVFAEAEILSLAYSANSELVRTGKARQMKSLIDQMKQSAGFKVGEENEA